MEAHGRLRRQKMALSKSNGVRSMIAAWRKGFALTKRKPQSIKQASPIHRASSLPHWETVHSVAALPKIRRIYTAADGEFALPASLCQVLVAIGDEAGQVWMLVDPESFAEHAIQLDSLHA